MKTKFFTYAAMALIVLSTACKKDNDNSTPDVINPNTNGAFSAKINNVNHESAEIGSLANAETDGAFVITSTDKAGTTIMITAPNKTGTFTGDNEHTSGTVTDNTDNVWISALDGGSVTVTVSKFDRSSNKVSGSFSFTAPPLNQNGAANKVVSGTFTDVKFYVSDDLED